MMDREIISHREICEILAEFEKELHKRFKEKGRHSLISKHEVLGHIEEEMHEMKEAIRGSNERFEEELTDVAIAAIFGLICSKGRYLEE